MLVFSVYISFIDSQRNESFQSSVNLSICFCVCVCCQGLIVDQTIEKVSFCAPDRNHEKGFAYICRDGTTRRWMCHGFLAIKESVCSLNLQYSVFH